MVIFLVKNILSPWRTAENIEKFKYLAPLLRKRRNRIKDPNPGYSVTVLDLNSNITTIYKSMRETAKNLNTDLSTLYRREKRNETKPFRNRYVISINKS